MIRSLGSSSSARTISMRWRSPTESVATIRSGSSASPYWRMISPMRCSSRRRGKAPSMPSAMFSNTLSASNSEKCWNTMPMPSARAARGLAIVTVSPFQAMVPASGCMMP
jgi:hypothetical protein